jgi:uncharacterized protein involved in tolerance to divalent cations
MKKENPVKSVTEELIKITKTTDAETQEAVYRYDITQVTEDDVPILILNLKKIEQDLMEWIEDGQG